MTDYEAEMAFRERHITLEEYHQLIDLDLFYRIIADMRREEERRQYEWETLHPVSVPADIDTQTVFVALAEASRQGDEKLRSYSWWRAAEDRGDNPDLLFDQRLGHATYQEVACIVAGLPMSKTHHITGTRRVVPHLKTLVEEGLVTPYYAPRSSTQSGWSITEQGERMLAKMADEEDDAS